MSTLNHSPHHFMGWKKVFDAQLPNSPCKVVPIAFGSDLAVPFSLGVCFSRPYNCSSYSTNYWVWKTCAAKSCFPESSQFLQALMTAKSISWKFLRK